MTRAQRAAYAAMAAAIDRARRASIVVETRFEMWAIDGAMWIFCPACGAVRTFAHPIRRVTENGYPVFLHADASCPVLRELQATSRAFLGDTVKECG